MNILTLENISKSFGERPLLDDISLVITDTEKIGLIGINGTGKSTLLNLIAGKEQPDAGEIKIPKGIRIEYLSQNPAILLPETELDPDVTVLDQALKSNLPAMQAMQEYEAALAGLAAAPDNAQLQEKLLQLSAKINMMDAWQLESQAKTILSKLGIDDFTRPVKTLSGGQKKRVALAGALITPCDLLILDEPTNHMDNQTVDWLEKYLENRKGALLLVTHDRYFLDRVANKIIELDHGKLYTYSGNYSLFVEKKNERTELLSARQAKLQSLYKKELEWMQTGARARTTKQKARIQRFEELKEAVTTGEEDRLDLAVGHSRLGKKIITIKNISKSFGHNQVIKDFSYRLSRNDRIGIIGPNGIGKSTLLNLLAGKLEVDEGSIETGSTVKIGYLSQESGGLWGEAQDVQGVDVQNSDLHAPYDGKGPGDAGDERGNKAAGKTDDVQDKAQAGAINDMQSGDEQINKVLQGMHNNAQTGNAPHGDVQGMRTVTQIDATDYAADMTGKTRDDDAQGNSLKDSINDKQAGMTGTEQPNNLLSNTDILQGNRPYDAQIDLHDNRHEPQSILRSELRGDLRALQYIKETAEYVAAADGTKISAAQMMERFLFPPDMQWTPIAKLSGGEKRRLTLLKILMTAPNILLLDEPTNDFDLDTLKVLEDYLDEFQGAVISISHDRYFLDRTCRRILSFEGDGIVVEHTGNYSDYFDYQKTEEYQKIIGQKTAKDQKSIHQRTGAGAINSQTKQLRKTSGKNSETPERQTGKTAERAPKGKFRGTTENTSKEATGGGTPESALGEIFGASKEKPKGNIGRVGGNPEVIKKHIVKLTFKEQREYKMLDAAIEDLEKDLARIEDEMAQNPSDYLKLQELVEQKERLEDELLSKLERQDYFSSLLV